MIILFHKLFISFPSKRYKWKHVSNDWDKIWWKQIRRIQFRDGDAAQ